LIYADSDFFLALIKESDWPKARAERVLHEHAGELWTSSATLIELLLLAEKLHLDPEQTLVNVLKIAQLRGGRAAVFLIAADYMKENHVHVFRCPACCFLRLGLPNHQLAQSVRPAGIEANTAGAGSRVF
jgi:hypothetical protein